MITPDYLAKVFVRMGYAFDEESCKRRLADWRQKGLLPPLKEKGRQHHGKLYYWDNPEITSQAVTVYKLFELHSRADWVILSTWFAGYDVSLHKVREIWVNRLESELSQLKKLVRSEEEMADALSRLEQQAMRKKKMNHIMRHEYYMSLVTNILYNPDFNFEDLEGESEFETLRLNFCPEITSQEDKIVFQNNIKSFSNFVNANFSLTSRYELLKNCSDRVLDQVHSDWRKAKAIVHWINQVVSLIGYENKDQLDLLVLIGRTFITMNLRFIKSGYSLKFTSSLNEMCKLLPSIDINKVKLRIQSPDIYTENPFEELRERIMYIWESTPMCTSEDFN